MSIPNAAIRYAGTWSATVQYFANNSVTSPINSKAYVTTINALGGADPSTGIATWVELPDGGSITQIVAGTGLSGGGTTGAVTLNNAGVLGITTNGVGGLVITGTAQNPIINGTASAPVVLTSGTGISVGTSPNYTITNTGVTGLIAGSGVTITGTSSLPIITATPPQFPVAFGTAALLGDNVNNNYYIPTGNPGNTYAATAPIVCLLQVPDGSTQNWIVYAQPYSLINQYILVSFSVPITLGVTVLVSWEVLATSSTTIAATTTPT